MSIISSYEYHEAANIFDIDEAHLEELASDIKVNGQQVSIEIFEGKILDGRRRWRACQIAGVKPVVRYVSPDEPVAYVISLNHHRRHSTPGQLVIAAAKARGIYDRQAKERQRLSEGAGNKGPVNLPDLSKGDARDAAGKAFGFSRRTVDYATKVLKDGDESLIDAVKTMKIAVSTAAEIAKLPKDQQMEEIKQPKLRAAYREESSPAAKVESVCVPKKQAPAKFPVEHVETKTFAFSVADVAITQIKRIPKGNDFRDAAFDRVIDWITSQRKLT